MAKRNFEAWLINMKDSIATWNYYTDFDKVYSNVNKIKVELNILNSLIGSKDIENEFKDLLKRYPEILKVIPILLAKREKEIKITSPDRNYDFNFSNMNYSIDEYALFMKNCGLFDLLQHHIVNNLVDYVTGIEVGMDTNGRKNRTGDSMEDLVESYLVKAGLVKDETYFKEMYKSDIEKKFNLDLSAISNEGKTEKRFDFVIKSPNGEIYACECNFYSGGGSKLNETARSYKELTIESKGIQNFNFVWFTDGIGWISARHNLEETFDVLDNLYNIQDMENGAIDDLVGLKDSIDDYLSHKKIK